MTYTLSGLNARGAPATFELRVPIGDGGGDVVLLQGKKVLSRIPAAALNVDCEPSEAGGIDCHIPPSVKGVWVDLPHHRVFLSLCRGSSSNCNPESVVAVSLPSLKVQTVGSIMGSMIELATVSPSGRYLAIVEAWHQSALAGPPSLFVIDLKTQQTRVLDFADEDEDDDEACAAGTGRCPTEVEDVSWEGTSTVVVDILHSVQHGKKWRQEEKSLRLPFRSLAQLDEE